MKHLFLLCLTLGVVPGFSEIRQTTVASIVLYTQFQQVPPAAVQLALHEELAAIMAPMGLTFEWRDLSSVTGREASLELAVFTFRGHCDLEGMLPRHGEPGALGWTHVSDGAILPFSDVDCDRIRSFVQKDLLGFPVRDREETYGRAIARVVAHELYHILANTSHHDSCGVAKAAYSVQELLSDDFQFEGRESQKLRTSRAHMVLEDAGRTQNP